VTPAPYSDGALIRIIRTKLREGSLPHDAPDAKSVLVGVGLTTLCCVCRHTIAADEQATRYHYPGGKDFDFHEHCEAAWIWEHNLRRERLARNRRGPSDK
jgi:hypothetical protein